MSSLAQFLVENKVAATVALAGTLVVLTTTQRKAGEKRRSGAHSGGAVTVQRVPAHSCLRLAYLTNGGATDHAKLADGEVTVAKYIGVEIYIARR
jgi:hypothetical protein